jgi:hyperosmotically inducible protein
MRRPIMLGVVMLAGTAFLAAPAGVGATQHTTGDKIENKAEKAESKVKRAAEKVESKTKSATEKAKTGVSDSWLTAKTKIALFADDRVKGRQVSVETNNGVVALRGKVDSEEAKNAAAEIAKGIEGIKSVRNDLQVVAPSQQKAVEAKDDDITRQVKDRLSRDMQLKKADIDVRTDAGVVTLKGEAPNIGVSARASEMAREVPGVRAVKNDLTLAATAGRNGAGMTMRSDSAAERQPGAMRNGSQEHIKAAQETLKGNGLDPGPVDGIMGPKTASALREYQKQNGLRVTGRLDAETMAKLGIDAGSRRKQSP